MYSLLVKDAQKVYSPADSATILEVKVCIYKSDDVKRKAVVTRKFGFPLGINKKDLQKELEKIIITYNKDCEALKTAEKEKQTDIAISGIVDKVISIG